MIGIIPRNRKIGIEKNVRLEFENSTSLKKPKILFIPYVSKILFVFRLNTKGSDGTELMTFWDGCNIHISGVLKNDILDPWKRVKKLTF